MLAYVIVGELFTDYSDHPRKLVAKPKTQINRRRTLASFPLVGCLPQAAWPERLLSEKSQDAVALQQIKERGALPMIDRGDIRQAIDRYSNMGFTAGRWLWSVQARGWQALIAKFKKRAERSERLMYEQSHRDYLALVICIIVCLSWAVNHYRDNAITYKAQRDKNARELKLANAAITDMQMRQ